MPNPYAPPITDWSSTSRVQEETRSNQHSLTKLKRIGWLWKYSQICLLAFIAAMIWYWATPTEALHPVLHGMPIVATSFTLWILVTLLAFNVYNLFGAILAAILMGFPLANIFTFLAVRDRAVTVLRQHGIRTGTFQMKLDEVAECQIQSRQVAGAEVKRKRSDIELAVTWAVIGLLLGFIAISIWATVFNA